MWVGSGGGVKTHGEVCFDPDGDTFYVKDKMVDGMSIAMRALYGGNTQSIFERREGGPPWRMRSGRTDSTMLRRTGRYMGGQSPKR
ncbi:hypothetical protein SAMN05216268_11316 [Streptomyces yunnanensis]|nr:hypothetical protein SAMN05216268_11316 [Streptomyces yunnanensis]